MKRPPFCENCGQDLRTQRTRITLSDETTARIRKEGWLCKSRFRKLGHFSVKGQMLLAEAFDLYAEANGAPRKEPEPDPWVLLEKLVRAGGKNRIPGGTYGPRQLKKALDDFHEFYEAHKQAVDVLAGRKGVDVLEYLAMK